MKELQPTDLLVFGYFGFLSNQLDGQTVKTRMIYALLKEKIGDDIKYFDTEVLKSNIAKILSAVFKITSAKILIYIPAQNNINKFFPFLYFLSRIFKFRIFYFVVGGWLPNFLQGRKLIVVWLRKIDYIFTETQLMKKELNDKFGISNAVVFPNFRFRNSFHRDENNTQTIRMVFMSRINKMKGIEMLIDFVKGTKLNVSLDFFGQVNPDDKEYFLANLRTCDKISYRGVLEPEEIQSILSTYDVLLLPTKYFTEGLPGAVIDAYFAGIPVIVTRWLHANEFVDHGVTGFIIPFNNGSDELEEYIELINSDRNLLHKLKRNSFEFSNRFSSEKAWEILSKRLEVE